MVTGGSGFIGRAFIDKMRLFDSVSLTVPLRYPQTDTLGPNFLRVGNSIGDASWVDSMADQDVVVHLAGRAHVLHDSSVDPLATFREVNVDGTLTLARLARDYGAKRFVFVSSIGVNGARTAGTPVNEESEPAPHADYALSKLEAEQGLREIVADSDMELVIIRPPLVYAGHAPGNFGRLLKLVAAGVPLPLASIRNQRSMIALENLVDFIVLSVGHPAAANELFVISDGQDMSTPDIVRYLAQGMNKSSKLFPIPSTLLRVGARAVGKSSMYSQLCESLVVDSSKARRLLGWHPVVSTGDALRKAGNDYLNARAAS